MNNTFNINRFKNLLVKDGKMYFRNFGTSLIVFSCLPAIFWIFNLLFGSNTESIFRYGFILIMVALAMLQVPSKVYGKANLAREGVSFATLPASSLEKFISMFIYCVIVTPILVFFGSYVVDALLSLFPFGGFDSPIHIYTLNELYNTKYDISAEEMDELYPMINSIVPLWALHANTYIGIIQWAAIFMLGNMLFKKHKAGKTFACYLGISYFFSIIGSAIMFTNQNVIDWMSGLQSYPPEKIMEIVHNGMMWGVGISFVVTAVILYLVYYKIKTQKY